MATVSLPISAEQAHKEAIAYAKRMNAGRYVPPVLPMLQKLSDETKCYIFNVSPMRYTRHMGSTGTFVIEAKEEGKDYSEPLVIPGIFFEPVPKNEAAMELQQDEGRYIAQQIIGTGKHLKESDSLTKYGVFISDTNPPNKKDLAKATAMFHKYCQILVNEANAAWGLGQAKFNESRNNEWFMAAGILGFTAQQLAWLGQAEAPQNRDKCQGCGRSYVVGTLKCECGYVLDLDGFKKAKAEGRYA
jgi:hypothetical protein